MIEIVEIGDIAWQGKTQPVICRASDGADYFVKGAYAGSKALVAEWIANRIGRSLQLPIPEFAILRLNPILAAYSLDQQRVKHLGLQPLFGSRRVPNAVELRHSDIAGINDLLRARILLFDWWTANSDRVFIEGAGNPNLLWRDDLQELVVIDHNLAFDLSMLADFWTEHAFRASIKLWTPHFRSAVTAECRAILKDLPTFWAEIPPEWTEVDHGLTLAGIHSVLSRFEEDADRFWRPV